MSTEKQAVEEVEDVDESTPDAETTAEPPEATAEPAEASAPSWWHRDHPTFTALAGFFTGLLFVALIPAIYVGVLSLMFDNQKVEDLFPFVLVTLVVPLGLVANQRTRRFGTYFCIGIVLTAVVVVGVAALVLWYLVDHQK
jgi:tetrahydromethanopterin S-methyltransferase subunit B